jgi:FkbM family methyltransferase
MLKLVARKEVEHLFRDGAEGGRDLKPFGALSFPYHAMGNVDSLNLFDLDELIIFSFYWLNRKRYHRVLDIGANIGLHSIMLSKCGYEVRCYEPDPKHFEILQRNLALNHCAKVTPINAAVSSSAGTLEFVRVLGNTTGSHLSGSKLNPYGELERFPVKVDAMPAIITWPDLLKLDAEGHEKDILSATTRENWTKLDALVEIGSEQNAAAVLKQFTDMGISMYSQKINWGQVRSLSDMPFSHHDGTLFIAGTGRPPWGGLDDGQA